MCYEVYLSTTSSADLLTAGDGSYHLERVDPADPCEFVQLLQFPHRWFLASRNGGCSCFFRHLAEGYGNVFGTPDVSVPEDPEDAEDPEDVQATAAVYDLIREIVSSGERLDLVDAWYGTPKDQMRSLEVSIAGVSRDAFRFFENTRINFRA